MTVLSPSVVYRELRKTGRWQVQVATTRGPAQLHAAVFGADGYTGASRMGGMFRLWYRLQRVDVSFTWEEGLPARELLFLLLLLPALFQLGH